MSHGILGLAEFSQVLPPLSPHSLSRCCAGAFRYVRLEGLTQAERDLLYQVRDFARFRR